MIWLPAGRPQTPPHRPSPSHPKDRRQTPKLCSPHLQQPHQSLQHLTQAPISFRSYIWHQGPPAPNLKSASSAIIKPTPLRDSAFYTCIWPQSDWSLKYMSSSYFCSSYFSITTEKYYLLYIQLSFSFNIWTEWQFNFMIIIIFKYIEMNFQNYCSP